MLSPSLFRKATARVASGVFILMLLLCQGQTTLAADWVDAQERIPDLLTDIRYAGHRNFVGHAIDGYLEPVCLLSVEAVNALMKAQSIVRKQGYRLKVFDCYRPQKAVDHFVRWAADLKDQKTKAQYYPEVDKQDLFKDGYIAERSGHSRGSTLDLTLVHITQEAPGSQSLATAQEVDMGTPWDFFSTQSWPFSDAVSEQQRANRLILREAMLAAGFNPYAQEWWHFTLRDEPFKDVYFDVPVRRLQK